MNEPSIKKPRRPLTALELSTAARGALRRIKRSTGMTFTFAVERGLALLENSVVIGSPMSAADRAEIGLKTRVGVVGVGRGSLESGPSARKRGAQ